MLWLCPRVSVYVHPRTAARRAGITVVPGPGWPQAVCARYLASLHTDTLSTWGLWGSSCRGVHWFEARSHCALQLSDTFKMLKWTGTDRLIEDERAAWALDSSLAAANAQWTPSVGMTPKAVPTPFPQLQTKYLSLFSFTSLEKNFIIMQTLLSGVVCALDQIEASESWTIGNGKEWAIT